MKICLVCNNAHGDDVFDGQHLKSRAYLNIFIKEGFDVRLVDLDKPFKNMFKILHQTKLGLKWCDVIVLVTCDNGERILVPYINKLNKKYKKRFIFSNIGSGSLSTYTKSLTPKQQFEFYHSHNYVNKKPSKIFANQLSKIDLILNETELITNTTNDFFGINNCRAMTNFRDLEYFDEVNKAPNDNSFKLVFFARVCELKGVFDLIDCFKRLETKHSNLVLDIYGKKSFSKKEEKRFAESLSDRIKYKGICNPKDAISIISKYDLLCFPTRAEFEGVPGTVVESLIAKTPILTSCFSQASQILNNGENSLFFEIFDTDDMVLKLDTILCDKVLYNTIKCGAKEAGRKYLYSYNRKQFLEYICGK